jgi:hypothetical protein
VPDEKMRDKARAMACLFATTSRTTMRLGRAAGRPKEQVCYDELQPGCGES